MRYRVYYTIPAHSYVTVEAEDQKEAVRKAEELRADDDEGTLDDWELDFNATAEFAFTLPD